MEKWDLEYCIELVEHCYMDNLTEQAKYMIDNRNKLLKKLVENKDKLSDDRIEKLLFDINYHNDWIKIKLKIH